MAKWRTFENQEGNLKFVFQNTYTNQAEVLGIMRPDTSDDLVIDWVIHQGSPSPGDLIVLSSGRVAFLMRGNGLA